MFNMSTITLKLFSKIKIIFAKKYLILFVLMYSHVKKKYSAIGLALFELFYTHIIKITL